MATLLELWSEWELQVLVLLSFVLQVFLFLFGGLRRRMTNTTLRLLLWLAYLVADFIAVYALGLLSHEKVKAVGVGEYHQLMFLWTPFLLIHLGGQDTITAFSVEDNQLWLRHLLNLLVQVGLALYVFWKSISHNPFVASTVFAFITGIIKYGERTWALKCASKKALRSSTTAGKVVCQFPGLEDDEQHQLGLSTLVRFALSSSQGVNDLFVGRKLRHMEGAVQTAFASGFYKNISRNGEVVFKVLEIELGMIYDNLYTKARVIYTWVGFILRLVTLVCLLVSFVLFLTEKNKWHHHSKADVAITYTLFVGAFCLDVCAIFLIVMMSPWTWAFLRSWKCNKLARAAWYVFKCAQPAKSTTISMGQYNFLSSCFSENVIISKMMNLFGANELWRNFRHTRFVDVSAAMKKTIFEDKYLDEILSSTGGQERRHLFHDEIASEYSSVFRVVNLILRRPLEEAIISLHIYTDIFLHPIGTSTSTEEVQHLVLICRTLSEYMCYLLVVHPDMLPVTGSTRDVLEKVSDAVAKIRGGGGRSTAAGRNNTALDIFLERLMARNDIYRRINTNNIFIIDPVTLAGYAFRKTQETMQRHPIRSLRLLVRAWLVVLVYAAGKSRGEANARHLSMGGELLTFLWLHLAHLSHGDMGTIELEFFQQAPVDEGGRKKFILERQYNRRRMHGLESPQEQED